MESCLFKLKDYLCSGWESCLQNKIVVKIEQNNKAHCDKIATSLNSNRISKGYARMRADNFLWNEAKIEETRLPYTHKLYSRLLMVKLRDVKKMKKIIEESSACSGKQFIYQVGTCSTFVRHNKQCTFYSVCLGGAEGFEGEMPVRQLDFFKYKWNDMKWIK